MKAINIYELYGLDETLRRWMIAYPQITQDEALSDLWNVGIHCNETYVAQNKRELESLNELYGVVKTPDELRGWHIAGCELYKRGVYRIMRSRSVCNGHEMAHGFVSQSILRVAIELGLCTRPNGFTLP